MKSSYLEEANDEKECNELLLEAIEQANQSLEAFKKTDKDRFRSAIYGRALANYLLGYLHFKHADRLDKIISKDDEGNDSLQKAKQVMYKAAKQFKEFEHFKGCQMAYK